MDFVTRVKLRLYERIAASAVVPTVAELAADLATPHLAIAGAFEELERQRLLVLAAGTGEIVMAPPFSAVETPHGATVGGLTYRANCAWDAFGVVAALGGTGVALTRSGGEGEELRFPVREGVPDAVPAVFHYAVPAARWWEDIVFT